MFWGHCSERFSFREKYVRSRYTLFCNFFGGGGLSTDVLFLFLYLFLLKYNLEAVLSCFYLDQSILYASNNIFYFYVQKLSTFTTSESLAKQLLRQVSLIALRNFGVLQWVNFLLQIS